MERTDGPDIYGRMVLADGRVIQNGAATRLLLRVLCKACSGRQSAVRAWLKVPYNTNTVADAIALGAWVGTPDRCTCGAALPVLNSPQVRQAIAKALRRPRDSTMGTLHV